jgi:BirA family biotin operon repressor/biotin-[acetyl-CoA-carboxylase] ligase
VPEIIGVDAKLVRLDLIRKCLRRLALNPEIVHLSHVDSTNDEAKRRIHSGMQEQLLILADTQTKGKGRYDRIWYSPEGGLYFSLVIKPVLALEYTPLLGLLCACAVAEALRLVGVNGACLKWPNDVLIDECKVAGILSEIISPSPDDYRVILGIGVNQNVDASAFPDELRYSVTSIIEHLGHPTSREELVCEILSAIERLLKTTHSEGSFATVLETWKTMNVTLGSRIQVTDGSSSYVGVAKDLLPDGSLLVKTEDGEIKVTTGDVRHLSQD